MFNLPECSIPFSSKDVTVICFNVSSTLCNCVNTIICPTIYCFLYMWLYVYVSSLSHLYQPQCSDRGTSQTPDGPGLFAGAHVWKFSPLQVLHAPYCSRPPLLCLCGHVQTYCGPATRQSVSWDCCRWWSKKERERPLRQGEREGEMRWIPLSVDLVFSAMA